MAAPAQLTRQKQDVTAARLDALGPVPASGWSASARAEALDRVIRPG